MVPQQVQEQVSIQRIAADIMVKLAAKTVLAHSDGALRGHPQSGAQPGEKLKDGRRLQVVGVQEVAASYDGLDLGDGLLHVRRRVPLGGEVAAEVLDVFQERPLVFCKECSQAFRPVTAHVRKFCSEECGHRVAARNWRRKDLEMKRRLKRKERANSRVIDVKGKDEQ